MQWGVRYELDWGCAQAYLTQRSILALDICYYPPFLAIDPPLAILLPPTRYLVTHASTTSNIPPSAPLHAVSERSDASRNANRRLDESNNVSENGFLRVVELSNSSTVLPRGHYLNQPPIAGCATTSERACCFATLPRAATR